MTEQPAGEHHTGTLNLTGEGNHEAPPPPVAAEIERIEFAIAANTPCRCGHPIDHHDAGECWTTADGQETWGETACECSGYEPAQVTKS